MLLNLYKTAKDTTLVTFLSNDFEQERWRTAASKNAFVLLSKQRYNLAAAFFLLGKSILRILFSFITTCETCDRECLIEFEICC
jgi:hypothetical protein